MVLITIIDDTKPAKEPVTGRITVDAERNCYEWVLTPKSRKATPELTKEDREELLRGKPPLKNMEKAARAKVIYAAGGDIEDILAGLKCSLSYAQKLHAAFERAI